VSRRAGFLLCFRRQDISWRRLRRGTLERLCARLTSLRLLRLDCEGPKQRDAEFYCPRAKRVLACFLSGYRNWKYSAKAVLDRLDSACQVNFIYSLLNFFLKLSWANHRASCPRNNWLTSKRTRIVRISINLINPSHRSGLNS
jgi:hypothetical protein